MQRIKREHFNSFFPTGDYRERKFRSQWASRRNQLNEAYSELCIARHEETARKNKLEIVAVMMCTTPNKQMQKENRFKN